MSGKSFAFRIYIVALVLRLIPVILARGLGIGLDDMFQYDMLARSIVTGNGFRWYAQEDLNQLASFVDFDLSTVKEYDPVLGIPTSFRAPLYPAFLAAVYFFSGTGFSRFFAARLAQAIFLGAPLAPLTYYVAQRLFPLRTGEARMEVGPHRAPGGVGRRLLSHASYLPSRSRNRKPIFHLASHVILFSFDIRRTTRWLSTMCLLASFWL